MAGSATVRQRDGGPGWGLRTGLAVAVALAFLLASAGIAAAEPVGTIGEFSIVTGGAPEGIAAGPDGNVWFVEYGFGYGETVGFITPAGQITRFAIPLSGSGARSIALGPDGNMWFTEYGVNDIGRITTAGRITQFPLARGAGPAGIAEGSDGNLWFTEAAGDAIGRITPTGQVTEFPLPAGVGGPGVEGGPVGIALGPEGDMWFTAYGFGTGEEIGRITPGGEIAEFPLPGVKSGSSLIAPAPDGIARGPEGDMWLTENAGDQIARIDPNSDQVSVFPIPIERARPLGIALGPDGDLWFTEYAEGLGQSIGRVTPSGEISEFQTPEAEAGPYGIAAGPDGNMWLTESTKGRIGRIGTGAAAALITPPSISGNGEVTNPQTCNPSTWTTLNAEQPLAGLYGYDGYHWSVEGKVIGAGSPFAPPLADVGQKLYCIQTVSYPQPLLLSDAASSAPVTLRPSPPIITGARLSSSRWREGEKSYRGVKGKKPPVGVTVAFTLNEAAPVSFSFEQRASGRRVKGKCVAETRANAGRGGCRRNIIVRRLLLPGRVNFNHIYFRGGLSGSRLMKPGRYTLVIRSKNANGTAHPASLSFTVLE